MAIAGLAGVLAQVGTTVPGTDPPGTDEGPDLVVKILGGGPDWVTISLGLLAPIVAVAVVVLGYRYQRTLASEQFERQSKESADRWDAQREHDLQVLKYDEKKEMFIDSISLVEELVAATKTYVDALVNREQYEEMENISGITGEEPSHLVPRLSEARHSAEAQLSALTRLDAKVSVLAPGEFADQLGNLRRYLQLAFYSAWLRDSTAGDASIPASELSDVIENLETVRAGTRRLSQLATAALNPGAPGPDTVDPTFRKVRVPKSKAGAAGQEAAPDTN